MIEKSENIIVLEEKVALLINRLKQNYLDIKNLSNELDKLTIIRKELDKDIFLLKEENKSLKITNNLLGSKEGNVITKNKINSIIKEVDLCINLITDIK
tara:strand:+ start:364 stop:660 length:297 start_codon:yes stop_codon:yes gene_type:complete